MLFKLNGDILQYGQPVEVNGVNWPYQSLTLMTTDELADLGIEVYTPPIPEPVSLSFDEYKQQRLDEVSAKRWLYESEGIKVDGVLIRSDLSSQSRIQGAKLLFDAAPDLTEIDWEATPNNWITVTKAQIEVIGVMVGLFVQGTFTSSKALKEAISAIVVDNYATEADAIAALSAIDINEGWPPNDVSTQ